MSPAIAPEREVRMKWGPKQHAALFDTTHALNVEGSLRSGKTTLALWAELTAMIEYPGLFTILSRWTEDATHALLKPLWRALQAGLSDGDPRAVAAGVRVSEARAKLLGLNAPTVVTGAGGGAVSVRIVHEALPA